MFSANTCKTLVGRLLASKKHEVPSPAQFLRVISSLFLCSSFAWNKTVYPELISEIYLTIHK